MENQTKQITIVKDWDWPDVRRQTPNNDGIWDGIHFSVGKPQECDALVVLNNRLQRPFSATIRGNNVWVLMQEPYVKGVTDWMVEKHGVFDKVFSHVIPGANDKYIRSHPAIPWHVNSTYKELATMSVPNKRKSLSWIIGNAKDLPGHIERWRFLKLLQQDRSFDIDLYGRAVRPIKYKNEGLLLYRYSLAVENTFTEDYWTEKIADCLLTWTVPIYYGCPNLENYFPSRSFIRIDIRKPRQALARIYEILAGDNWEARMAAVGEARKLILNQYQLFPHLCSLIKTYADNDNQRKSVTIPPYRRSPKAYLYHRWYKCKKAFGVIPGISI